MHWDQMTATPQDLRERATRARRGIGQTGVLEAIIDAAYDTWLGAIAIDGRGTVELRMHLAGRYRLTAVVTSAGKLDPVQLTSPVTEQVLSTKPSARRGWDAGQEMPKQPEWLDFVIEWIMHANEEVDQRAVLEWRLNGADLKLTAMNDTIESLRTSLREREQLRDELAAEVAKLRAELEAGTPTP